MYKMWILKLAGILNIISGAFQLVVAIGAFQWLYSSHTRIITEYAQSPAYTPEGHLLRFFIPFFLSGLLAVGGGISATKRDKTMALVWAGAIAASFPLLISWTFISEAYLITFDDKAYVLTGLLGIASLILIGQYKIDFIEQYQVWRHAISEKWTRINQRWMTVNTKWMPITAGILSILIGPFQLYFAIWFSIMGRISDTSAAQEWELNLFAYTLILNGLLAIFGGIYAIRKTKLHLAVAGSIAASGLFPFVVMHPLFSGLALFSGLGGIIRLYSGIFHHAPWLLIFILLGLATVLAISGGIYIMLKTVWHPIIAGFIATLAFLSLFGYLPSFVISPSWSFILILLLIAPIVLTVLSKKEFE